MDRRGFIATAVAAAAGLAGCASDSPAGTTTDTRTTAGTATTTETPARTAGSTTTESTTTAPTTAVTGVENTPVAVARAFYTALIAGNVERANSFSHPESPSPNFPVSEEDVPSRDVTVEEVTRVERVEDTVAVDVSVTLSTGNGTPRKRTETIALRLYEGRWMIWRSDYCEKVSC